MIPRLIGIGIGVSLAGVFWGSTLYFVVAMI